MRKDINVLSEVAIFLAGALAAGLMTSRRREAAPAAPATPPAASGESPSVVELRRALAELEARLSGQESASSQRFGQLEARIEEQSAKLAEVPSTKQIVGAMEQLLSKTMASLDERLTTQAQSIEVLRTTVSQTDSLLERVLESLDSLQTYAEPLETGDTLLHRPAV
jgi:chromosome segregation ATPase